MPRCEVLVDRCSLVVGKGSIVNIDERQFELARQFVKPLDAPKLEKVEKVVEENQDVVEKEEPKKKNKK